MSWAGLRSIFSWRRGEDADFVRVALAERPSDVLTVRPLPLRQIFVLGIALIFFGSAFDKLSGSVDAVSTSDVGDFFSDVGIVLCAFVLQGALGLMFYSQRRGSSLGLAGLLSSWPFWAMRCHMKSGSGPGRAVALAVTLPFWAARGSHQWRAAAAHEPSKVETAPAGYRQSPRAAIRRSGSARTAPYRRYPDLEGPVQVELGPDANVAVLANGSWAFVLVDSAWLPHARARKLLTTTAVKAAQAWRPRRHEPGEADDGGRLYESEHVLAIARRFMSTRSPLALPNVAMLAHCGHDFGEVSGSRGGEAQ